MNELLSGTWATIVREAGVSREAVRGRCWPVRRVLRRATNRGGRRDHRIGPALSVNETSVSSSRRKEWELRDYGAAQAVFSRRTNGSFTGDGFTDAARGAILLPPRFVAALGWPACGRSAKCSAWCVFWDAAPERWWGGRLGNRARASPRRDDWYGASWYSGEDGGRRAAVQFSAKRAMQTWSSSSRMN